MSAEIHKYISEISNSLDLISRRIEFETLQDRISRMTSECENPEIWKDQSLAKGADKHFIINDGKISLGKNAK